MISKATKGKICVVIGRYFRRARATQGKNHPVNEELAAQLLLTASHGQLMDWLTNPDLPLEDRARAIDCLVQLHRAHLIDVFKHMHFPSGPDSWRVDLTAWSHIYQDIIPLLEDDAGRVVSGIATISKGSLGPFVQKAFLSWCASNTQRVDDVLALEYLPDTPEFCLTAALIGGLRIDAAAYLDTAVAYARGLHRSRTPGIRGMAAMSVENDEAVKRALVALENVHDDAHTPIEDRTDALVAALELAQRCGESLDGAIDSFLEKVIASKQPELLAACANFIARFDARLRSSLIPPLVRALRELDIDVLEWSATIDAALYSLLRHGQQEEALVSLEVLMRKSQANDPLDILRSTAHHLSHGDRKILPTTICRWLLTGEATLCAGARNLLNLTGNQKYIFDFDPGNLSWSDDHTLYLARKAIGWLMPHGTGPASFLICLLRGASEKACKELTKLLFDPLLINYPRAVRVYLETIGPDLAAGAKVHVDEVLALDDSYKQGLRSIGFVPELQPNERQRWIEHERQTGAFTEARQRAEGRSALAQLFSRKTLLFGTRAISYVDDPGGKTRRLDNYLGSHRYETDNVMGWAYDPFNLDYTLRVFRVEHKPE